MDQPHENVLRQVGRLATVAGHVEREAEHRRMMDPVQLGECLPVAFAETFHQIAIQAAAAIFGTFRKLYTRSCRYPLHPVYDDIVTGQELSSKFLFKSPDGILIPWNVEKR